MSLGCSRPSSSATPNTDSGDGYVPPAYVGVVAASPRCALCRRSCAARSSPSTSSGAVARYTGPRSANGAGIALERKRCELLPPGSTRHSGRSVSHTARRVHSRGRSRRAARPASPIADKEVSSERERTYEAFSTRFRINTPN